jgi:hypothetical protein
MGQMVKCVKMQFDLAMSPACDECFLALNGIIKHLFFCILPLVLSG